MARDRTLSAISNPLITSKQLIAHKKRHDDIANLNNQTFHINLLTQSAGVLLRLPQEIIATSIIILQRYLTTDLTSEWHQDTSDKGQKFTSDSYLIKASSASIYLSAKQSFYPLSPRSIINVYALLTSPNSPLPSPYEQSSPSPEHPIDPHAHYISEGTYTHHQQNLFTTERQILTALSYTTKVVTPYTLALTYLLSLSSATPTLSERVISHLNAALLSPQLLYLTHQPHAIAVAAIYFAARELGVNLVDEEDVAWWEVFDVGREELGFLVLAMGSSDGFVEGWRGG